MPIGSKEFDFVRALVKQRSAIVLEPGKEYLVETRLAPLAREKGLKSVDELVGLMQSQPHGDVVAKVIDAMTTNETSFFRDIHPFEALKAKIIPEILQAKQSEKTLNIWSCACSSGQEIYSTSMMLRETFPQLGGWTVRMLATDLSKDILARARAGLFSQLEVNRGLPAMMLVKYFQREGTDWRIKEDLRKGVEFREMNLIEPWPPLPVFDIVFLRNVLIYFDSETKKTILDRMGKNMRPGAYLFLGGAETTVGLSDRFDLARIDKAQCYRWKGGK